MLRPLLLMVFLPTAALAQGSAPVEPSDSPAPVAPEPVEPVNEPSTGSDATVEESPFQPLPPATVPESPRSGDTPDASAPTEPEQPASGRAPSPPSPPHGPLSTVIPQPAPSPKPPGVYGDPNRRFELSMDGYLRTELACIYPSSFCGIGTPQDQDARRNPYVGRNDGFALGGARLNLRGRYGEDLYVRVSLAGEAQTFEDPVDPVARTSAAVQAAYFTYRLGKGLNLHLGRFRPPFDAQSLTALEGLFFVRRALSSRGVARQEGFVSGDLGGFSPGRQLGAMLSGEVSVGDETQVLSYYLALTNGNPGELSLNDNDRPAVYGRLVFEKRDSTRFQNYHRRDEEGPATLWLEDGFRVGLGGFVNELTSGAPPNRLNDRVFGGGIDVAAKYSYVIFDAQLLLRQVQHLTRGDSADERGFAAHAQISFDVLGTGFYPGYRFSILDPRQPVTDVTAIETSDSDAVVHHTVGVKWISESLPLMGFLEYTVSLEEEGRELPNDRVEAALQVIFE